MTEGIEDVKRDKIQEDEMLIVCVGDVNCSTYVFVVTAEGCFTLSLSLKSSNFL